MSKTKKYLLATSVAIAAVAAPTAAFAADGSSQGETQEIKAIEMVSQTGEIRYIHIDFVMEYLDEKGYKLTEDGIKDLITANVDYLDEALTDEQKSQYLPTGEKNEDTEVDNENEDADNDTEVDTKLTEGQLEQINLLSKDYATKVIESDGVDKALNKFFENLTQKGGAFEKDFIEYIEGDLTILVENFLEGKENSATLDNLEEFLLEFEAEVGAEIERFINENENYQKHLNVLIEDLTKLEEGQLGELTKNYHAQVTALVDETLADEAVKAFEAQAEQDIYNLVFDLSYEKGIEWGEELFENYEPDAAIDFVGLGDLTYTTAENVTETLDLKMYFTSANNETLTFNTEVVYGDSVNLSINSTGDIITITPTAPGENLVKTIVTDESGNERVEYVTINFEGKNFLNEKDNKAAEEEKAKEQKDKKVLVDKNGNIIKPGEVFDKSRIEDTEDEKKLPQTGAESNGFTGAIGASLVALGAAVALRRKKQA